MQFIIPGGDVEGQIFTMIIAFLFSKTISPGNELCVEYMYSQGMYNDICLNYDPGGMVGGGGLDWRSNIYIEVNIHT